MKKDQLVYIEHILEAIEKIENSLRKITKEEFKDNLDKQDATIRRLEIIGEATKNLTKEFMNQHMDIPWSEIIKTRDKLIHHYFGIDLDLVFEITKEEIPTLKKQLTKIIKKE